MKILLTNHWLKKIAGSETFTYAMAGELKRQGHEVDLFTNVPGMISRRICNDYKIEMIPEANGKHYDLILANHNTTVDKVFFKDGLIVQTIHGIFPALEKPNLKAHKFVSISQEIKNDLLSKDLDSTLIWNGIDCKRFNIQTKCNEEVKRVLSLSTSETLNDQLRSALSKRKISLITLNKFKNPVWDVENYINQVDLVITLGRGAYESLACGRSVLVLDNRPYMKTLGDGIVTPENISEIIQCNFSGRKYQRTNIEEMITEALGKYNFHNSEFFRNFAVHHLNIAKQTKKYIELLTE